MDRNISVSGIAQGVKAFFKQDAGFTRGKVWAKTRKQEHARTQEQLQETRQRLTRVRQQLRKKNDKLVELQEVLGKLEAASSQQQGLRKDIPIFFIVGRPKSGTSWLRLSLDQHPEILCKGEGEFFGRIKEGEQPRLGRPLDDITPPTDRTLYTALAHSELLRSWIENSVWRHGHDTEAHINGLTREAIYYFLRQRLSQSKKRMVGDKTPFASPEIVKEIGAICPEAKVVHIIRDGRDTAVSQLHQMWNRAATPEEEGWYHMAPEEVDKRDRYRKDPQGFLDSGEGIFTEKRLRQAAEGWKSDVGAAHQDGPVLLGDNYTEVRYENMLERPEEELGRLLRFLGADADEDIVAQCVEATRFEKRSGGRERGEEDSGTFLRKGIAGDWKNVFTERDKAIFKEVAGDLLIELGYEENKAW
jgi:hypothetical protein